MNRRAFLFTPAALLPGAGDPRQDFLRQIDRPRVPLAPESRPSDGAEYFTFNTQLGQRVPGLAVKPPASGRLPVVVALHGTGGTKEGQRALLQRLAGRGFLAVAIDGRYHGERSHSGKGSAEYVDAMLRVYRGAKEFPFLYDTVWDLMRLVDYLTTRPDVDPTRIGMIGFSKGGMELYLAAAVDPRIAVAVPCIGVQSFRWALDHNAWHSRVGTFQAAVDAAARDAGRPVDAAFLRAFYDRVAPAVYSDFDGPRMLPLIAPRPLLVINGDSDARTPMGGLRQCLDAAKQAYAKSPETFRVMIQPDTGHKVNPEALDAAVAWFEQWLRPTRNPARL